MFHWTIVVLLMVAVQDSQPASRPAVKLSKQELADLAVLVAWNDRERELEVSKLEKKLAAAENELAAGPPKNRGKSYHPKWKKDLEDLITKLKGEIEFTKNERIFDAPRLSKFGIGNWGRLVTFRAAEIRQNASATEKIVRPADEDWWISGWRWTAVADREVVDLSDAIGIIEQPKTFTTVLGANRTINHIRVFSKKVLDAFRDGQRP
ncbi:MAG: hypothetical protein IT450_15770 [Phycisphaerales bacterium]|nr:hypothetical protein [Phycisphaerales bacterium]